MIDLIPWLGQRITDRWQGTLVLPGVLYAALAGWAVLTGHGHALDPAYLVDQVEGLYQAAAVSTVLLSAVAGLALATVVGAGATTVAAQIVHKVFVAPAPRWWRRRLQKRTRMVWDNRRPRPAERYLPTRATATGERLRLVGERVDAQYGLSVRDIWPHLWLLMGAEAREVVADAHHRYRRDTVVVAWGLLYLPWALWWWPAGVVAVAAVLVGCRRSRGSAEVLAMVIEAAVDAHQSALAAAVGVALPENRVTPEIGWRINDIVTRGGAAPDWLAAAYRLRVTRRGGDPPAESTGPPAQVV